MLKTPEDVKTIIRITNSKTRMILLRFFDLVETEFPMNHLVIFNLVSKVVHCFFGFVSLRWDWLRKLEPLSHFSEIPRDDCGTILSRRKTIIYNQLALQQGFLGDFSPDTRREEIAANSRLEIE